MKFRVYSYKMLVLYVLLAINAIIVISYLTPLYNSELGSYNNLPEKAVLVSGCFILFGSITTSLCAIMDETTSPTKFNVELTGGERDSSTCIKMTRAI